LYHFLPDFLPFGKKPRKTKNRLQISMAAAHPTGCLIAFSPALALRAAVVAFYSAGLRRRASVNILSLVWIGTK